LLGKEAVRKRTIVFGGIIAAIITVVAILAANPLRRSEEKIGVWLEAQTPLGSSPAEVIAYAQKKNWPVKRNQGSDGRTRGEFVRGEVGEYRTVFVTSVTVFWEFDSTSRLEKIRVWKTVDAL
jgi:hypothetical protein